MQRLVITTGGTGGHIFPALAVAEEIRKRYPRVSILFLGGQYGPEADLAVQAGLDFVGLPVRGVIGRGLKGLGAAFSMGRAFVKALGIIRKFSPQLVVGFGGYAAFAGVLAGSFTASRTALHEQNAFPGLSNRILGRRVNRIFLSMPDASGVFPAAKCLLTGNPVRAAIAALHKESLLESKIEAKGRGPRLLVIGGSQGARALNDGVLAILDKLLEEGVELRHQTGKADYERVRTAYREVGAENAFVGAFIDDMAEAYNWADLVLSRAGASSLAEITAAGLPAVLVPFPHAARDHQRYNAAYLEQEGAAVLLEQKVFYGDGAEPSRLSDSLLSMAKNKGRLADMARKSFALARPDAAAKIVDSLESLLMRK